MKEIVYNENNLSDYDISREVRRAKVIIVNSEDEIILAFCHNNYFLVGGHVEENETFDECIVREIKEETGINISLEKREPILSIKYYSRDYPSMGTNTKFISNYYVINFDLKEDLEQVNLTEDEIDGHFELRKIHKDKILNELENNLITCTKENVVKDTMEAIKEYLIQRG